MGRSDEKGEMTWGELMLFGGAFMRPILKDSGFFLEEGVVIVLDDELQAKQFVSYFVALSCGVGRSVNEWKQRNRQSINNYCCCFFIISRRTKEEDIADFLSEDSFVPIVVCGGILPEYMKDFHYFFRLGKEDWGSLKSGDFTRKVQEWKAFIVNHSNFVARTISNMKRSIVIEQAKSYEEYEKIFSFIVCVGRVYATYLNEHSSEQKAMEFWENYLKETKTRIQMFPEFKTMNQTSEIFAERVWSYMASDKEIVLIDTEKVDGSAYERIQESKAILFDNQFYYMSNKLFEEVCNPLLVTISIPELKHRMSEQEILSCNSSDYTVKKQIVTIYGAKERVRVLRINKEALMSDDNLLLEDVFA